MCFLALPPPLLFLSLKLDEAQDGLFNVIIAALITLSPRLAIAPF